VPHPRLTFFLGFLFRCGFLDRRYHFIDAIAVPRFEPNVAQRRDWEGFGVQGSGFVVQ